MSISVEKSLNQVGYINIKKKADTLQGSVLTAVNKLTNEEIVIKITNKRLHKNGMAVADNVTFGGIKENILSEAAIIQYLTDKEGMPTSVVKFHDFFQCNVNYYLIMENGGEDLFHFVVKAQKLIEMQRIRMFEWHRAVKCIFRQMIQSIEFVHSQNVAHFDISLENFLINDVQINCVENVQKKQSKISFICSDIQIKLIDFGLAKWFKDRTNFDSNKHCGKVGYKSPEMTSKNSTFNAKSNDIWCLGVCLFLMIFGCAPWQKATDSDELFVLMMNGCIMDVLRAWNKTEYANEDLIDLFQSFFQDENKRISLDEIKKHKWLKY